MILLLSVMHFPLGFRLSSSFYPGLPARISTSLSRWVAFCPVLLYVLLDATLFKQSTPERFFSQCHGKPACHLMLLYTMDSARLRAFNLSLQGIFPNSYGCIETTNTDRLC